MSDKIELHDYSIANNNSERRWKGTLEDAEDEGGGGGGGGGGGKNKIKNEKQLQLLLGSMTRDDDDDDDVMNIYNQSDLNVLWCSERDRARLLREAARHDKLKRLNSILSSFDLNSIDEKTGETALHVAAEGGRLEAVQILLSHHVNVNARDNRGYSALHSAFRSRTLNHQVIRLLVQALRSRPLTLLPEGGGGRRDSRQSTYRQWTMDQVDDSDNTPLHVAVLYMSSSADRQVSLRCIKELNNFDPNRTNKDGDSALHLAAKRCSFLLLDVMIDVFYSFNKDIESHVRDSEGNSLLDIASVKADGEMVGLLIDYGADPRREDTLRKIISESVRKPEKTENLCRVYSLIIENVEKWRSPDRSSREEIIQLLNNSSSPEGQDGGRNAIEFAIDVGAVKMLEVMLHMKELYQRQTDGRYKFRVKYCRPSSERISLIERIINFRKDEIGAQLMNVEPLRHISSLYIWYSSVLYCFLFLCQMVYMICFCIFCIPDICQLSGHFQSSTGSQLNTTGCQGYLSIGNDSLIRDKIGFLIWPLVTLIGSLSIMILHCKTSDLLRLQLQDLVGHLFHLVFGVVVCIWFAVFVEASNYRLYTEVTAALFIFGWLQAFRYLSYLGEMYIFTSLVTQIIFKDFLKLATILVFVVVGFAFAIHTLFQTTNIYYVDHDVTDTVYLTFSAILGLGTLFADSLLDSDFDKAGGDVIALRVVLIAYLIASFIILLNILIAMMSNTYQSNNKTAKVLWKYHIVRFSLIFLRRKTDDRIEESLIPQILAESIIGSVHSSSSADEDSARSIISDVTGGCFSGVSSSFQIMMDGRHRHSVHPTA